MMPAKRRLTLSIAILALAIVADQVIKFAVKLSMFKHESIRVFDWFYIYFTENKGMAFGMELFDKLFLTGFRVVAVTFITYYLFKIINNMKFPSGYILCVALVLAGALGNLIDSLFYGEIFTDSNGRVAELVSWGNGYGDFLYSTMKVTVIGVAGGTGSGKSTLVKRLQEAFHNDDVADRKSTR